jgi:hypothetical protein
MSNEANQLLSEETSQLKTKGKAARVQQQELLPEAVVTVPAAASSTVALDTNAVVASLMAQVAALQAQLTASQPVVVKKDFGPAPLARRNRPHIMVAVTPDTTIRREVPQSYIDAKRPGWDGTTVKGYVRHQNTLHVR